MSNSNNKKTSSKPTSFNKSKSKSISDAMKDLEMGRPISKKETDFETKLNDILKEESISDDEYLEIDDSSIDFDSGSEGSILTELNMEGINLEDLEKDSYSSNNDISDNYSSLDVLEDNSDVVDNNSESDIDDLLNDIFVSPDEGIAESSLDDEVPIIEDVVVTNFDSESKSKFNSDSDFKVNSEDSKSKFSPDSKSKFNFDSKSSISKDSLNFFNAIKSRFTVKSLRSIFSSRSKILALLGIIIGLIIIIYGIMNFSNVSDRVVDHVLLGEAGSWSIFMILIGLIIILLDIFFVFYYKQYLKNSSVNNVKLRHTFDTIDKIKSIDSDYYEEDDLTDVSIKGLFKRKEEKESPTDIKNSIFDNETINSDSKTVSDYTVDDNDLNDSSSYLDSFDDE